MKILFYGDSITDMGRERNVDAGRQNQPCVLGFGHPILVAGDLYRESPKKYKVLNKGVGGDRIVDLYARIKKDVWNENPDVISILIGTNDVWHEMDFKNGVEKDRWDRIYRMLIDDTLKVLPNVKIMICEPFVLRGSATAEIYDKIIEIKEYAKVARKIAKDYNFPFVELQDKLDEYSEKYGVEDYLFDGVHPNVAGARLIADEWLKVFKEKVIK